MTSDDEQSEQSEQSTPLENNRPVLATAPLDTHCRIKKK
jgi:hypothetical protein